MGIKICMVFIVSCEKCFSSDLNGLHCIVQNLNVNVDTEILHLFKLLTNKDWFISFCVV